MQHAPLIPQALHGYPVDARVRDGRRARRRTRRGLAGVRALGALLRRGAPAQR
jgi:hypothetical protein